MRDWAMAIADFDEAVRLMPTRAEGYRWRASVYLRSGNSERAAADSAPRPISIPRIRITTWAGQAAQ